MCELSSFLFLCLICVSGDAGASDALDYFTESLAKFTKFSGFRCLATLSYASDIYSSSSIVSRWDRAPWRYDPAAADNINYNAQIEILAEKSFVFTR